MPKNKRKWILINRIHINGSNQENSWNSLKKALKFRKLKNIEDTKALALTTKSVAEISRKLEQYNKKNNTDFFI